jgi:hypothetical protein
MNPSAPTNTARAAALHRDQGVLWASVIAALFVAVAAISFAIDQSVTLSSLPALQPAQTTGQ